MHAAEGTPASLPRQEAACVDDSNLDHFDWDDEYASEKKPEATYPNRDLIKVF